MASPADSSGGRDADDALLTAWLDGALDADARAALDRRLAAEPALAERLAYVSRADRPFGPAFDALLAAAPAERLNAMLAETVASTAPLITSARGAAAWWRMAAAAVVLLTAGAVAGYIAHELTPPPYKGWRQVVAEYHALITPDTVAIIDEDQAGLSSELAAVSERMTLDLAPERIALAEAELKRVQLYDYGGRPLVQLVYLLPGGEPFALCIIANGRDDGEMDFEQREGSNIVYWYKGGYGYMLIAKTASREELEAYAGDIAARLS